jgi:hypothetical protein
MLRAQLEDIAKAKMKDLTVADLMPQSVLLPVLPVPWV